MKLRKLTIQEMKAVYNRHLCLIFPRDEVKPFSVIQEHYEHGVYEGYGMFLDGNIVGFAFLVRIQHKQMYLLDYLAVISEKRNCGYGSLILQSLAQSLPEADGLIIEIETPEKAENLQFQRVRENRRMFYLKNHCHLTDIKTQVYHVDYDIMYMAIRKEPDEKQITDSLEEIYASLFSNRLFTLFR